MPSSCSSGKSTVLIPKGIRIKGSELTNKRFFEDCFGKKRHTGKNRWGKMSRGLYKVVFFQQQQQHQLRGKARGYDASAGRRETRNEYSEVISVCSEMWRRRVGGGGGGGSPFSKQPTTGDPRASELPAPPPFDIDFAIHPPARERREQEEVEEEEKGWCLDNPGGRAECERALCIS